MSFLNIESFWLMLLLVPVFILRNHKELSLVSYGYIFTFILLVIAIARPVIEQEPVKREQVLSDVLIAVDLSYSMRADDIKPNRLTKASESLKEFVKANKEFRYGVIGFTTNAIVLSPLTQDSELLTHLYESLDENLIMTKGSSIMPALELAAKMSRSKTKSVLILSDGADEDSYEAEAKFAKENNLVVNVYMLATTYGGTLLKEDGELVKDELGDIVVSRENEAISVIADATGGVYTKSFTEIVDALDSQKNQEHKTKTMIMQNVELFYYFVTLAIIVFLITVTTLKKYVAALLLLLGVSLEASNLEYFKNATQHYKAGEYEKALENYEKVRSANPEVKSVVFYNIGNTFIRLKEFEKAKEAFLKSLTLQYSIEADENMHYIRNAHKNKQMSTGQQKTDKKSSFAKKEKSSKKQKSGGSSNMKVSAPASSGSDNAGKKTKSDPMLNLNKGNAKLSSKQYELINKRGVNEKKPW